jgi:serine phosphatase RsbU (regulator of sigma subunit)
MLICADGRVEVLERTPNRLLGVSPDADRVDHELQLNPGDTLLLYTDGLVERREVPLDEGTARLVRELGRIGREPLDRLCDHLVSTMGTDLDDDVALLAVRLPCDERVPQPGPVGQPQR